MFDIQPDFIYESAVEYRKNRTFIKANSKYIGKKVIVIVDKRNAIDGMTDEEGRKLADMWEKSSI